MPGTVQLRETFQITSGAINYTSSPSSYTDTNVNNTNPPKGPTPGAINVPIGGTTVDLSQLIVPGYCWIQNLSNTGLLEYGIRDSNTHNFYPLGLVKAGMSQRIFFSPNLGKADEPGSGTHTSGTSTKFYLKGYTADMGSPLAFAARVDAFEN